MSRKLSILAVLLLGTAMCAPMKHERQIAPLSAGPSKDTEWGPIERGLQLGAWRERDPRYVYGLVRNSNSDTIHYIVCWWAYSSSATCDDPSFRIKEATSTDWRTLLYCPENRISPNGVIKDTLRVRRRSVVPNGVIPPFNGDEQHPQLTPEGRAYTFVVDLSIYCWPKFLTDDVMLQLRLGLDNKGRRGTWSGKVVSGEVPIPRQEYLAFPSYGQEP